MGTGGGGYGKYTPSVFRRIRQRNLLARLASKSGNGRVHTMVGTGPAYGKKVGSGKRSGNICNPAIGGMERCGTGMERCGAGVGSGGSGGGGSTRSDIPVQKPGKECIVRFNCGIFDICCVRGAVEKPPESWARRSIEGLTLIPIKIRRELWALRTRGIYLLQGSEAPLMFTRKH